MSVTSLLSDMDLKHMNACSKLIRRFLASAPAPGRTPDAERALRLFLCAAAAHQARFYAENGHSMGYVFRQFRSLLLGMTAVGKDALLTTLFKLPLGFSGKNVSTRRPEEFTVTQDPDLPDGAVRVELQWPGGNTQVFSSIAESTNARKAAHESMAPSGGAPMFEEEPAEISVVVGPDVVVNDAFVTNLMGLIALPAAGADGQLPTDDPGTQVFELVQSALDKVLNGGGAAAGDRAGSGMVYVVYDAAASVNLTWTSLEVLREWKANKSSPYSKQIVFVRTFGDQFALPAGASYETPDQIHEHIFSDILSSYPGAQCFMVANYSGDVGVLSQAQLVDELERTATNFVDNLLPTMRQCIEDNNPGFLATPDGQQQWARLTACIGNDNLINQFQESMASGAARDLVKWQTDHFEWSLAALREANDALVAAKKGDTAKVGNDVHEVCDCMQQNLPSFTLGNPCLGKPKIVTLFNSLVHKYAKTMEQEFANVVFPVSGFRAEFLPANVSSVEDLWKQACNTVPNYDVPHYALNGRLNRFMEALIAFVNLVELPAGDPVVIKAMAAFGPAMLGAHNPDRAVCAHIASQTQELVSWAQQFAANYVPFLAAEVMQACLEFSTHLVVQRQQPWPVGLEEQLEQAVRVCFQHDLRLALVNAAGQQPSMLIPSVVKQMALALAPSSKYDVSLRALPEKEYTQIFRHSALVYTGAFLSAPVMQGLERFFLMADTLPAGVSKFLFKTFTHSLVGGDRVLQAMGVDLDQFRVFDDEHARRFVVSPDQCTAEFSHARDVGGYVISAVPRDTQAVLLPAYFTLPLPKAANEARELMNALFDEDGTALLLDQLARMDRLLQVAREHGAFVEAVAELYEQWPQLAKFGGSGPGLAARRQHAAQIESFAARMAQFRQQNERQICQSQAHQACMSTPAASKTAPRSLAARTGIVNTTGLHCFVAAALQCLASSSVFSEHLSMQTRQASGGGGGEQPQLATALLKLIGQVNGEEGAALRAHTRHITDAMARPPADGQQDVVEFAQRLLHELDVPELTAGQASRTIQCMNCMEERKTDETNFFVLPLAPGASSRGGSMQEHVDATLNEVSSLTGANQVWCEKCGSTRQDAQQRWLLSEAPELLIVTAPAPPGHQANLVATEFSHFHLEDGTQFELIGVCLHSGSLDSGHYVAVVRHVDDDDCWFLANDSLVKSIDLGKLAPNLGQPYAFFYQKCGQPDEQRNNAEKGRSWFSFTGRGGL